MWTFNVKTPKQPQKPSDYTLAIATVVAGVVLGVIFSRRR